jgi:hypothetical protein
VISTGIKLQRWELPAIMMEKKVFYNDLIHDVFDISICIQIMTGILQLS